MYAVYLFRRECDSRHLHQKNSNTPSGVFLFLLNFFIFFIGWMKLRFIVMAFTLDRETAARRLGVSTRTIDRHIQSDRIKTRRVGKKIFLEEDDVESLRMEDSARASEDYITVLSEEPLMSEREATTEIIPKNDAKFALAEFSRVYQDARTLIAKKDSLIQDLSYKLGKVETELENSVHINEYKKATYMYETLKHEQEEKNRQYLDRVQDLQAEVQKRNSVLVGIVLLFLCVMMAAGIFIFWDRLM